MVGFALLAGIAVGTAEERRDVSGAEKRAFLVLLKALPHRGEFFTDEAIKTTMPHMRVWLGSARSICSLWASSVRAFGS